MADPNPPNQQQVITQTEHTSDKINKTRTMYDASAGEIMWKNFLAGLMRGFGSLLIWFLFFGVMFQIFMAVMWPKFEPFVDQYQQALESINQINQTKQTIDQQFDTGAVNSILKQLNQLQ